MILKIMKNCKEKKQKMIFTGILTQCASIFHLLSHLIFQTIQVRKFYYHPIS